MNSSAFRNQKPLGHLKYPVEVVREDLDSYENDTGLHGIGDLLAKRGLITIIKAPSKEI